VWLDIGKKGNQVASFGYDDAVEDALCFGWIDGTASQLDDSRFKQHFTPRKRGGTWARTNKKRVARLAEQRLLAPAGIAAIEAAKADESWTLLDTVDALVIPEGLVAALAGSPGAERAFAALAPSARKMALYWIVSAHAPGHPREADSGNSRCGSIRRCRSPRRSNCREPGSTSAKVKKCQWLVVGWCHEPIR
jgi:uncharacterized protein YdeI (YjbR/CyaY-like superfamily)